MFALKEASSEQPENSTNNEALLILSNWTKTLNIDNKKNAAKELYQIIIAYYGNNYLFVLISNNGAFGWKLQNYNPSSHDSVINNRLTLDPASNVSKRYKYHKYDNYIYRYGGNDHSTIDRCRIGRDFRLKWNILHEVEELKTANWNYGKFGVLNNNIFLLMGGQFEGRASSMGMMGCSVNSDIISININTNKVRKCPFRARNIKYVHQFNQKCAFINAAKSVLFYPNTSKVVEFIGDEDKTFSDKLSWIAPYHIENDNKMYGGHGNDVVYFDGAKQKWFHKQQNKSPINDAGYTSLKWFNDNPNVLLSVHIVNTIDASLRYSSREGLNLLLLKENLYRYDETLFNVNFELKRQVWDIRCDEWCEMHGISINLGPIEWKENMCTDPNYDPYWNERPRQYHKHQCLIRNIHPHLLTF